MYEEDRQRAIELYGRMFLEANDDVALLQQLVSPTRQAVVVARAYNSNLAKLSVQTKAAPEDRDENGVPDYVQAIEKVRAQAWAALGVSEQAEDEEESAEETAAEEEPIAQTEAEEPDAAEEGETPAEAEEEASAEAEPEEAGAEPEAPEDETPDEIPEDRPQAHAANESVPESAAPGGIEFFTLPEKEELPEAHEIDTALEEKGFNVNSDALRKSRRQPKFFLLFVYILFAIPITLCAIAVLLVPALLFLALSVAAIICGVVLIIAAFRGFPVFADIMVLLGVSLVLFALGLLFLWTAIWFVGGAIVSLVHGVAALCDKWCYKEVSEG